MTTTRSRVMTMSLTGPLAELSDEAKAFAVRAHAESTRRAYRADLRDFEAYCRSRQLAAVPAEPATVAGYVAELATRGLKMSTIERRLVALDQVHKARGLAAPSAAPLVDRVLKGIRRQLGTRPERKAPVLVDDLEAMLRATADSLGGLRDRALLLVGFAGALRRSELVALDVSDVVFRDDGLVVDIRRSKTDPEGQGRSVGIPYGKRPERCAVRALRAWLDAVAITSGPLFRPVDKHGHPRARHLDGRAVARIVKRTAKAAGLDPKAVSGHSLRAGLATAAALAGAAERAIMNQTGHTSVRSVRRYIRDAQLFRDNAAAAVL